MKISSLNNSTWKGKNSKLQEECEQHFFSLNGKELFKRFKSDCLVENMWDQKLPQKKKTPPVERGEVCQKYKNWWDNNSWSSLKSDHYDYDLWLRDFFHWYVGIILGGRSTQETPICRIWHVDGGHQKDFIYQNSANSIGVSVKKRVFCVFAL